MVQFDNQFRQIRVKIVYYGPAQGGKTTCLQHVHRVTDPQRRAKLYSLNTASDRTLFFDLLSLNLGRIRGFRLSVQLYTVPGQVQYNATRRAVLSGADGVVFVADSQAAQRQPNLDSLDNLRENLAANALDIDTIPLVFQYNKRDLDGLLDRNELERTLNHRSVPCFDTIATSGEGVMEAFAAVTELTLIGVAERLGVGASEQAIRRLEEQVRTALRPLVEGAARAVASDEVEVTTPLEATSPEAVLGPESLVGEAVRVNLAMTDLNTRLDTVSRQLDRKVTVLGGIAEFSRKVAEQRDPRAVLRELVDTAADLLQVRGAAALLVPRSGALREAAVRGINHDPLLATVDEAGEPIAAGLLEGRRPRLFARHLDGEEEGGGFQLAAVEGAGFGSAVAVPMVVLNRSLGLLTCYADRDRQPLDEDDLQLAMVLAASAAMAHVGAEAWQQLQASHLDLEGQVAERTQQLERNVERVQQLADDLAEKNRMLEAAYAELTELDRFKADLLTRVAGSLKSPVGAVLNAARLLADGSGGQTDQRGARFVTIIRDQAERLSEMIQGVVQASLLTADQPRSELQRVAVEELLRRTVAPLRDLAAARGVRISILIPGGSQSIVCEPATTEAALRAVVKNAIEFSQSSGTVKLEVRRVARGDVPSLMVRVTDTGVGIPEQDLGRVFDTFWQGGSAPDGRARGLGLGLTIAKRVVERHGGSIAIASQLAGGTEVTVSLPQPGD